MIKKKKKKKNLENKVTRPTNYKVKSTIQNCIEKYVAKVLWQKPWPSNGDMGVFK